MMATWPLPPQTSGAAAGVTALPLHSQVLWAVAGAVAGMEEVQSRLAPASIQKAGATRGGGLLRLPSSKAGAVTGGAGALLVPPDSQAGAAGALVLPHHGREAGAGHPLPAPPLPPNMEVGAVAGAAGVPLVHGLPPTGGPPRRTLRLLHPSAYRAPCSSSSSITSTWNACSNTHCMPRTRLCNDSSTHALPRSDSSMPRYPSSSSSRACSSSSYNNTIISTNTSNNSSSTAHFSTSSSTASLAPAALTWMPRQRCCWCLSSEQPVVAGVEAAAGVETAACGLCARWVS